jgi:YggT family protein
MSNDYIGSAAIYLISTLFSFYLGLVMIRFLLQLVRADFHNPLSQFIVKVTNPPLRPLRRIIPGISGIDVASLVLLLCLQVLMMWLLHLATGRAIHVGGLLLLSLAELISLLLTIYLIAIIAQAILSWIGPHPHTYNPFSSLLYSLTEPVMRPARRLIPPISGIDLSPILVIVILQLMKILVVAPITDLGRSLGYN